MKTLKNTGLFILLTIVFSFSVGEFALRLRKGALLDFQNTLYKPFFLQSDRFHAGYPEEFDPILGWVPLSEKTIRANWGGMVRTEKFGIRSNGGKSNKATRPMLALGGSFTFGDQVADNQTWPSHLEKLTNTRILNAGVSGYGFDQILLRLENLLKKDLAPSKVIIAVTSQNIGLVSFSQRWGLNKPYFEVEDHRLILKNTPVKPREKYPKLDRVRATLGHSYVVSVIMSRLAPEYWTSGLNYKFQSEPVASDWREISCAITKKLSEVIKKHKAEGLVVFQYEKVTERYDFEVRDQMKNCTQRFGLGFLDTYPALESIKTVSPTTFENFYSWHMTDSGNAFIAKQIFDKIKSL